MLCCRHAWMCFYWQCGSTTLQLSKLKALVLSSQENASTEPKKALNDQFKEARPWPKEKQMQTSCTGRAFAAPTTSERFDHIHPCTSNEVLRAEHHALSSSMLMTVTRQILASY